MQAASEKDTDVADPTEILEHIALLKTMLDEHFKSSRRRFQDDAAIRDAIERLIVVRHNAT